MIKKISGKKTSRISKIDDINNILKIKRELSGIKLSCIKLSGNNQKELDNIILALDNLYLNVMRDMFFEVAMPRGRFAGLINASTDKQISDTADIRQIHDTAYAEWFGEIAGRD